MSKTPIIVDGKTLYQIAFHSGINYATILTRYQSGKQTMEELTQPVKERNYVHKSFLKKYGVGITEYARQHGLPPATVRYRFVNGNDLINAEPKLYAGKPMEYWMEKTGLTYGVIYGRWLTRGDEMTIENLMQIKKGYENVSMLNSKTKPISRATPMDLDSVSSVDKKKRARVLKALAKERNYA